MERLKYKIERIIVTGAGGVGKTTLVESLGQKLGFPIIPEMARELCKTMGYEQIWEIPDHEEFRKNVLRAQIIAEEEYSLFISDRSTIDCWVLWQRWHICQAMSSVTEDYYQMARKQAERYDHIIYIPLVFSPNEDGFRWTDLHYQKQVDRLIRMTLYDWSLLSRTYTVRSTTPDERLSETEQYLSGLREPDNAL